MLKYDLIHVGEFMELLTKRRWRMRGDMFGEWTQFRYCHAWTKAVILEDENGETFEAYLLQSYNWLVAVFIPSTGECVRLIKYSRTTSKQTTQWENAIRNYGWRSLLC